MASSLRKPQNFKCPGFGSRALQSDTNQSQNKNPTQKSHSTKIYPVDRFQTIYLGARYTSPPLHKISGSEMTYNQNPQDPQNWHRIWSESTQNDLHTHLQNRSQQHVNDQNAFTPPLTHFHHPSPSEKPPLDLHILYKNGFKVLREKCFSLPSDLLFRVFRLLPAHRGGKITFQYLRISFLPNMSKKRSIWTLLLKISQKEDIHF